MLEKLQQLIGSGQKENIELAVEMSQGLGLYEQLSQPYADFGNQTNRPTYGTVYEHTPAGLIKFLTEEKLDFVFLFGSLKVPSLPLLKILEIHESYLPELSLLHVKNLSALYISDCQELESLQLDCPELKDIVIYDTKLSAVDLIKCPKLTAFECLYSALKTIDFSLCPNITEIDLSQNLLTEFELSNKEQVKKVNVSDNAITNLKITNCPKLNVLNANSNHIETVEISDCPNLRRLVLWSNNIREFNVTNCPNLEELDIEAGLHETDYPKHLDLSAFNKLKLVVCHYLPNPAYLCIPDIPNLQVHANKNTTIIKKRIEK